MELFDTLPAPIRTAINDAGFEFAPRYAAKLLARGIPVERAAEIIREADLRLMRRGGVA